MIKNILLDCDGVLYPLKELQTKDIVEAMKHTYRYKVGLTPEEQKYVSEKTIAENHLGMFNYINEICRFKNYDFDVFCEDVAKQIDYSSIMPNQPLWQAIKNAGRQYNVAIFSNNSRAHINEVSKRVFSKSVEDIEAGGINVYDIKFTEKNGYFRPKQDEKGFISFLQRLNLKADETILFDDAPVNIKRAKAAGMKAVLISAENPLIDELKKISGTMIKKNRIYE